MPSISLSNVSWVTPEGRPIFEGLNLSFAPERVGMVGRNGIGKTTLLHVLAGLLPPSGGRVIVDGSVQIVRQEVQPKPGVTVADLFGVADRYAVLRRAERGEATIEELSMADWTLEDRIRTSLMRVDLDADGSTLISELSGGQRTRVSLAAAIFSEPDFLLLDEPTNNLDREGRAAVAELISGWSAGLIAVSHDRELLERMDAIVEMTSLGASRYGGNWSSYRARKAVELDAAEHDLAHAQKREAEVQRKARIAQERQVRREAAGSRKAARGDMPRLLMGARKNAAETSSGNGKRVADRLATEARKAVAAARARVEVLQQLSIVLPSTELSADRHVLELADVSAGYAFDDPIIEGFSLSIVGPDRVAVSGPNGAGKSTLVKLISGQLAPLRGDVRVGVKIATIDQEVAFLDRRATILDNFMRLNPTASENACFAALAGFLFRADSARQVVGTLSGGQMVRAGLACLLGGAAPPQFLILDEPTNHLDLESVNAVEAALQAYDGALLVVSHDDAFLQNISVNRRLELESALKSSTRSLEPAEL